MIINIFCAEEAIPPQTPIVEAEEDNYIMSTSLAPITVYSPSSKRISGSSVEGMIYDMIKYVEVMLLTLIINLQYIAY